MKILTLSFLLFFVIFVLSQELQPCEPFGVRLNYGKAFTTNKKSHQKAGLRFNTKQKCSHLQLKINSENTIESCFVLDQTIFPLEQKVGKYHVNYTTHIHVCSLTKEIHWGQPFAYSIIDSDSNEVLFSESDVLIRDPHDKRELKVLHVADWGDVGKYINERKPIIDTLVQLVNSKSAQAIILNGDIGYQINTGAQHHEQFLSTLQKVSRKIPMIINRGNHQYNSASKWFRHYYQSYDLFQKNATGIEVGPVYFGMYDPYAAIMPDFYKDYTIQQRFSSYFNFEKVLEKASKLNKTIVALSHYPIICGYPTSKYCLPNDQINQILPFYVNLGRYYNQMIKYQIPLILSGHVHTYQRSFPMLQGYKIYNDKNQSWYNYNQTRFFVQVVDGAAGSMHKDLYMDYKGDKHQVEGKLQKFVANHIQGKTGFGLATFQVNSIRYQHYALSVTEATQITDDFVIHLQQKDSQKSEDQLLDEQEDKIKESDSEQTEDNQEL